ncbi:AAA family ATPase [Lignipirellula cremea]|uniref:Septum site-determining protein MinD n=1 Tax=Lignipirellula cremea TaxID=2528010 RepID=A0A518DM59_9BACT|nr:P-loop NTPase [Lignipirellula cremea]QDU92930.1 Septum site-determining protein MinD [Lignipirellula cremea]
MKAFIASDNDPLAFKLADTLQDLGVSCSESNVLSLAQILDHGGQFEFNDALVLLDSSTRSELLLARLPEVAKAPGAFFVIFGPSCAPRQIVEFIRAGANDYLDLSHHPSEELAAIVKRLQASRKESDACGRLISITSCNSGCGASTIAASLATLLSQQSGSCGLLDLHLTGGDLAVLLQLEPRHTLLELAQQADTLDAAMLQQSLSQHASGVNLLASPEPFVNHRDISSAAISRIVQLARMQFSQVVVDLEDMFHQEQVSTLRESDEIVMIFRPDFVSLVRARKSLDFMYESGVQHEKIRLVASRCGQPRQLSLSVVENSLGAKIAACIPEDPVAVLTSINLGVPVVSESPDSKFSRALSAFVDQLNGVTKAVLRPRFSTNAFNAVTSLWGKASL